jgi:hypothetical protein
VSAAFFYHPNPKEQWVMKKNPYKNKFATLLLSSVFVAVVALLASSCIVVVDDKYGAEVRYTWKSTHMGIFAKWLH